MYADVLGPLAVRHEYARKFAAASEKFGKTAAAIINLSEPDMRDIFQAKHMPVFDAATDACFQDAAGYIDYGKFLQRHPAATKDGAAASTARPAAEAILRPIRPCRCCRKRRPPSCSVFIVLSALKVLQLPVATMPKRPPRKLGYPVIAKAMVPNMAHRSDAGLVSGKVSDVAELRQAFSMPQAKARALARSDVTVSVEKFVPHDFEVILGVKYDATFGPVILCGLGGIFTEVLNDFALRLAPLTQMDAEECCRRSRRFRFCAKAGAPQKPDRRAASPVGSRSRLEWPDQRRRYQSDRTEQDSSETTVLDAKIHIRATWRDNS